ncbi:hypothetical protein TK90_2881 (plasmid) [Thioalkalivibrio sp. K90mix]|uniref:conjugative transfer protein MobI(A/C) n=1 Tax=Thioalkalivibrio sp. (strain K90mix) TaxID=396595 RepID=UPI000195A951|nr:conjugative transfer protein MobI(A/C) [Thioalkalivibrio sp. K90mix]ADC73365.1 hypothetical protein TK90_2881 [Thioalkalivibrio sp. K90mix]
MNGNQRKERQIRDLDERLDDWLRELQEDAEAVAKEFQDAAYASRDNENSSKWFRYMVRVRTPEKTGKRGVSIEWLKSRWQRVAGKNTFRADYVRKGPKHRYNTHLFKPVDSQEGKLIENAEDQFERIREEVALIGSLRKVMANSRRNDKRRKEEGK